MCIGATGGVEVDEVPRTLPPERRARQLIDDDVCRLVGETKWLEVDVDVALLALLGVEVGDDEDRRSDAGRVRLRVAEQRRVGRVVEVQRAQVGEGGLLAADLVEAGEERRQAAWLLEVPLADLVLLGVEVLLGARSHRRVLAELERRPVDAPRRRQRRRQCGPAGEHRAAAGLQLLGEDVGRVRPGVGPEVVDGARRQVLEVLAQLPRRLAPGEVGVRLVEADLGEALHHAGPGEGLGEEDRLGVLAADDADRPLPEGERLGVRVVDAERRDAAADPEPDHLGQLLPQTRPVLALEVERVDVLVLLRWVLGVLDRAVGPVSEPLGMLGDPRVVGRALEGDVERQLHVALAAAGRQLDDVLDRSQLRVHGGVAALRAADRPGAAGVVG